MSDMDTIAAPITPVIVSAVTAVRVSGSKSKDVYNLMTKPDGSNVDVSKIKPNNMSRYIFNIPADNIKDDVMAVYFKGPNSFTGEDVLEIYFHGNPVLVMSALSSIYSLGIRPAEGGEFSKRAFLNGKIDLTQAESIQELISAKSLDGINAAYNQLSGSLKYELDSIKDILLKMKAILEAKIDFPDEDTVDEETEILKNNGKTAVEKCVRLISSYSGYRNSNKGIDIVLAGKPNVGKSSLMNLFLREERAIVSNIPGTTRDFIKESLYIGGTPVHLTDTAGIHSSVEGIEQQGIERSRYKISNADLILLLLDISKPLTKEDEEILLMTEGLKRIVVGNKIDLVDKPTYDKADIYISASKGINMEELTKKIISFVSLYDNVNLTGGVAVTERHKNGLEEIKVILEKIINALGVYPVDMICLDLEQAINILSEITGEHYTEKVLDIVFSSFCIGK